MNIKRLFVFTVTVLLGLTLVSMWMLILSAPQESALAASYTVCLAGPPTCDFSSIQAAIDAAGNGDSLELAGDTFTESITINKSITIQGVDDTSTIVQAAVSPGIANNRVITVTNGVSVTISDIRVRYGVTSHSGGGILTRGDLSIKYSTIISNVASGGGGGISLSSDSNNSKLTILESAIIDNDAFVGGGLGTSTPMDSHSFIEIIDSTLSNNNAGQGGGIGNSAIDFATSVITITNSILNGNTSDQYSGGGILNFCDFGGNIELSLINSTISNNTAVGDGGGIENKALFCNTSAINVVTSTVAHNSANNGGGIYNVSDSGSAIITITNSVLHNNMADTNGGGIYNHDLVGTSTSLVSMNNSTLSGNNANEKGGGIYTYGSSASITLNNSTLGSNSATNGGGIFIEGNPSISLANSVIADSPNGGDCVNDIGSINDNGYNLVEDGSCAFPSGGDPNLGPLQDNGGPTFTHALLLGSPAVDAGSCSDVTSDQRGFPRPVDVSTISNADDGCDIGAFEVQKVPPTINGTQGGQTVDDNTSIKPFTSVTIEDQNGDTLTVKVSLDNDAKGYLSTLGGFVEGPSGTYTFVGSPSSATTAIQGLTFNPTENRKPPGGTDTTTFTISADDDYYDPITDETTTVIATSINDPPTIEGTVAGQTVDDDATIDPFSAVTIADPDKNASLTVVVSLDDPDTATLTNLGGFVPGPAGTYTFAGSPTESTSAIQGLTFVPTKNRVPVGDTDTTTFTISIDDGIIALPVTDDTTTVIATSINDPPTISGTAAGQTVDDNATIDPFSTVTIADPDVNTTLTVTVTLDNADKGNLINLSGFVEGPDGTYTFTGSPAPSTTAILGLNFIPTEGRVPEGQTETTTFTISADDGIAAPVTDDTTTVFVTAVEESKKLFLPMILR